MAWMRISFRKAEDSFVMETEKATVMGHSACEFSANSRGVTNPLFWISLTLRYTEQELPVETELTGQVLKTSV